MGKQNSDGEDAPRGSAPDDDDGDSALEITLGVNEVALLGVISFFGLLCRLLL